MTIEPSESRLLAVDGLSVCYRSRGSRVRAVEGVSFDVAPGEVVALVGESGSGKSTVARTVTQQLASNAVIESGQVMFDAMNLLRLKERQSRQIRGKEIGFVPQDPMVSLNPTHRVGKQITEVLAAHQIPGDHTELMLAALGRAGLRDPESRAKQYPHELSGGLRQRILIAIAMACNPKLLVADEPTSALDVTVQRRILDNIQQMNRDLGLAVLLITHDIGIAAERANRIVVMSNGIVVETGAAQEVIRSPQHPYTKRLMASAPNLTSPRFISPKRLDEDGPSEPLMKAEGVRKVFDLHGRGSGTITAVDHVSLSIRRNETVSIVGESGSGKTTFARLVMGLERPTEGSIIVGGSRIDGASRSEVRRIRRQLQMVYQSPYASLDQRLSVESIIGEPLRAYRIGDRKSRSARVKELLDLVSLRASYAERRPAELSGGEQQRVAIARALALSPTLVVCDEPVSGLDVFVQEQVLRLLVELQRELGLSYLFISHDLAIVRLISDRVAVMHNGRIVESGEVEELFANPQDEYTQELLAAVPNSARVS